MDACLKLISWMTELESSVLYSLQSLYTQVRSITFWAIYKDKELKWKANQEQLKQQGTFFWSFVALKKNVQENTTNTINKPLLKFNC